MFIMSVRGLSGIAHNQRCPVTNECKLVVS